MKRKDTVMTDRLIEELLRLPESNKDIATRIGCSRRIISDWLAGRHAPSIFHLKGMHFAGMDVLYIITGKRYKITPL